jgi:hypothetical protein
MQCKMQLTLVYYIVAGATLVEDGTDGRTVGYTLEWYSKMLGKRLPRGCLLLLFAILVAETLAFASVASGFILASLLLLLRRITVEWSDCCGCGSI